MNKLHSAPDDADLKKIIQEIEEDEEVSAQEGERRKLREEERAGTITEGNSVEAVEHWLNYRQEAKDRQVLERLWKVLDFADIDRMEDLKERVDEKRAELLKQAPSGDKNTAWRNTQLKKHSEDILEGASGIKAKLQKADQILKSIVYANRDRRNEEHYKKVQTALDKLAEEMLPHARVIESESIQDIIDSFIPDADDEKVMKLIQTKLRDAEMVRKSKKLVQESGAYNLATQIILEMLSRPENQKNPEYYSALEKKVKTELDQMALGAAAQPDEEKVREALRKTEKLGKISNEPDGKNQDIGEALDWMDE